MIEDLAFCLKSFERHHIAQRCVDSILAMWPDAKIYQADDSRSPKSCNGVAEFWPLPFDVGCSAGRNHLVRHTKEPFIVQVDDDYIFTPETDVVRLAILLMDHHDLVLAGCKCRHIRKSKTGWTKYFADVELDDNGVLWARRPTRWNQEADGLQWAEVDTVSNFWVAKRRLFDCMMWDERLKIGGEHADFFQRLQVSNGHANMAARLLARRGRAPQDRPQVPIIMAGQMKVAFVPSLYVSHKKHRPPQYQKYRKRDKTYEMDYRRRWGIRKVNRWRYGNA